MSLLSTCVQAQLTGVTRLRPEMLRPCSSLAGPYPRSPGTRTNRAFELLEGDGPAAPDDVSQLGGRKSPLYDRHPGTDALLLERDLHFRLQARPVGRRRRARHDETTRPIDHPEHARLAVQLVLVGSPRRGPQPPTRASHSVSTIPPGCSGSRYHSFWASASTNVSNTSPGAASISRSTLSSWLTPFPPCSSRDSPRARRAGTPKGAGNARSTASHPPTARVRAGTRASVRPSRWSRDQPPLAPGRASPSPSATCQRVPSARRSWRGPARDAPG